MSRQNRFDGLIHNKDGSTEFHDSGAVDGVNKYAQRQSHRDELEPNELSDWNDDERNHKNDH